METLEAKIMRYERELATIQNRQYYLGQKEGRIREILNSLEIQQYKQLAGKL